MHIEMISAYSDIHEVVMHGDDIGYDHGILGLRIVSNSLDVWCSIWQYFFSSGGMFSIHVLEMGRICFRASFLRTQA